MAQYDPYTIKSGLPRRIDTDTCRADKVGVAGLTTAALASGDACQVSAALTLQKALYTSTGAIVGIYDAVSGSVVRSGVVVATMAAGVILANGDTVYLSNTAGALTNIKPTMDVLHEVGVVVDAASARILLQQKPCVVLPASPDYSSIIWTLSGAVPPAHTSVFVPMAFGYHAVRDVAILVVPNGGANAATWQYNPATDVWTDLGQALPTAVGGTLAYDSHRAQLIKFGNDTGGINDLWAWDGVWAAKANFPRVSEGASTWSYDPVAQRCITTSCHYSQTWEYDPAADSWAGPYTTGLPDRHAATQAFMPSLGKTVLWGGDWLGALPTETWAYTQATHTWATLAPIAFPNPGRTALGGWYDTARGRFFIAGGASGATRYDEVWGFDGTTWTQYSDSMLSGMTGFGCCYDTLRNLIYVTSSSNPVWTHTAIGSPA